MDKRDLYIGDIVTHFKGDNYKIIGFGMHTETHEALVFYQAMYPPYAMYARPEEMFLSEVDHVKYPEVDCTYRMSLHTRVAPGSSQG